MQYVEPTNSKTVVTTGEKAVHGPVRQFDALTGLRAVAALGVLICHFSEIDTDRNIYFNWGWLQPLFIHGAVGVDIFFVLSGFILAHVYRKKFSSPFSFRDWAGFMQYRFARIYPVHIATMLVMAGIYVIGRRLGSLPHHANAFTPISVLANLTMTHAWFPHYVAAMNGPAWSISAEWFAYLLFPISYYLLTRTGKIWPAIVIGLASTMLYNYPGSNPLIQIALEFPIGMAVLAIYSSFKIDTGRWGAIVPLAMILFSCYVLSATDPIPAQQIQTGGHLRMGMVLAAAILLLCLTSSKDAIGKILSTRVLVYAGEISYSVYMCHWAIWVSLSKGIAHLRYFKDLPHLAFMLAALVITIACSMLCYHFIEVPGRLFLRGISATKDRRTELVSAGIKVPASN